MSQLAWAFCPFAMALATFAARRWSPGWRVAFLTPIASVLFALPLLAVDGIQEPLIAQSLCCVLSVSAFKVLALMQGRGCLADPTLDLRTFVGVFLLPIIPLPTAPGPSKRTGIALAKIRAGLGKLVSFALLAAVSFIVAHEADRRTSHPAASALVVLLAKWAKFATCFTGGIALLLEVDGVGDLVDATALRGFGLAVEPHFNRMWLSSSFADLWGRRWNLTMSSVLRAAFYDAVVEGRFFAAAAPVKQLSECGMPPSSPPAAAAGAPRAAASSTTDSTCLPASPAAGAADGNTKHARVAMAAGDASGEDAAGTPFKTPYRSGNGRPRSNGDAAAAAVARSYSSVSSLSDTGSITASLGGGSGGATPADSSLCSSASDASSNITAVTSGAGAGSLLAAVVPLRGGGGDKDASRAGGSGAELRRRHHAAVAAAAALAAVDEAAASQSPRHSACASPAKPPRPSRMRRNLGILLTFVVSGLWHELVCLTMTHRTSGGYWMLLFTLQAPILTVEAELRRKARSAGVRVPPLLARVATLFSFFVMLSLLWYPPMRHTGMLDSLAAKGDQALAVASGAAERAAALLAAVAAALAPGGPAAAATA